VPYPPAVDDLSAVLTAGNTAVNTITLQDATSSTIYSTAEINAGNVVGSIDYTIASNGSVSTDRFARLDLTSGDITAYTPRAVLQAFVDVNASPSYPPNCNLIDLGGAVAGNTLLIANGNSDPANAGAYNTITMYSDTVVNNSYIELKTIDTGTSAGATLTLGQDNFNLSITNQTAFSIGQSFVAPIVVRRNISTTTTTGLGQAVGLLENSVTNATTTGTTTLSFTDAFATIINSPTAPARIFVLPAPTAGTAGYWYAICNRATANTIAVQQPLGTTIATIPISPALGNGGSVVRFAVNSTGASYFRVN